MDTMQILSLMEDDFRFDSKLTMDTKESYQTLHQMAVLIICQHALHHKLKVKELRTILCDIPQDYYLHEYLIKPYLHLVNDIDIIAKKYGAMYLTFLSEKHQGLENDKYIVDNMFDTCEDVYEAKISD